MVSSSPSEVVGLPHSPSSEGFIKVIMAHDSQVGSAAPKHGFLATEHHTFPRCGGDEPVQAMDLQPGDCLHTTTGKGLVQSAVPVPVAEGDVTYTIELLNADLVAVGGIFTHAKMDKAQAEQSKKAMRGGSNDAMKRLQDREGRLRARVRAAEEHIKLKVHATSVVNASAMIGNLRSKAKQKLRFGTH